MSVDKRVKYASQGGVKNYLGQQPMVEAPKYWQSSPDHPTTELAYITPAEKDLLVKKDLHGSLNGGVNRGPSGIMSLNGWGSSDPGQNRAGAEISGAMDTDPGGKGAAGWADTKMAHTTATGKSPAELNLLAGKKGSTTVMPGSHFGKGPTKQKSGIGGLVLGALLSMINPALGMAYRGYTGLQGLKDKFGTQLGDWRENLTGYRTQDEWEKAREQRQLQGRLDNLFARKDAGKKFSQKNLDALLAQGIQPSTARNVLTGRDLNLRGQVSKGPMGDPMWSNQPNRQILDVMAAGGDGLTYAEVLANQNRAKMTAPNSSPMADPMWSGITNTNVARSSPEIMLASAAADGHSPYWGSNPNYNLGMQNTPGTPETLNFKII
jgi:hypothetical protein